MTGTIARASSKNFPEIWMRRKPRQVYVVCARRGYSTPRRASKNRRKTPYITEMRPQDILMPVAAGLCCKPGGFHIDPVRPVARAVITHGHSDHARSGHGAVLATQETLDMMRLRYGDNFAGSTQAIAYGEKIK